MEYVENLVIGAGPAGLRAAQVLAEAGREVLVLEKNEEVGPKTCGGGLSVKTVRELRELGLPAGVGLDLVAQASFQDEGLVSLDPGHALIRTISRRRLGGFQAAWARAAGAELRTGIPAGRFDLEGGTLEAGGRRLRYRHLIGADGSRSTVRRALGLTSPRAFFAGEYNIPGLRLEHLSVAYDSAVLASGYFWIFPHEEYTCIGAGGHKELVPPATVRPYLHRRMAELGVDPGATEYEGATIEIDFTGFDFPHGVYLVGDAAGMPSGLTAEGIYAALITGEEVARSILEPGYPRPKTRSWLRTKRAHDVVGRLWLRRLPRELSFSALPHLCRWRRSNQWLSAFFLEG